MDYKDIVNQINKYHYLFVTKKKIILLASNNSSTEAKEKTLNKINSKLDSFIGKTIVKLKVSKVKTEVYEKSKTAKLTSIGGPIIIEIDFFKVNEKGKIKINEEDTRNDTIYITENFLKDNKVTILDIKKIVYKAYYNQLRKTILSVNTIDKI